MGEIKALIIGGNGFIGSNLSAYLADKGMEVYSFDLLEPRRQNEKVHYIQGDFFDDRMLRHALEGKDVIYHAISTINPGNSNEKYMSGYCGDFIQTVKMCSFLNNTHAKLIFLSSGGTVYGNQKIQPIPENAVAAPINHYGNVKLCIENMMRIFDIQAEAKMLVARISNPYGPGQDFKKGVGFIDAVIKKALNHETLEIWGNGEIVRDYIYISDVCELLYALALYEGKEIIFNISSGVGFSQNEILDIVQREVAPVKYVYKMARSVDVPKIVLDNTQIRRVCDIRFVGIEDGIKKYREYLRTNVNTPSRETAT